MGNRVKLESNMKGKSFGKVSFWVMIGIILCGTFMKCATPISPTGGPADKEAPKLLSTVPESNTTFFSQKSIRFTFDEYIDRNSFKSAFRIEPSIALNYDVSFKRKTAIITFNNALPDSVTLLCIVGTGLKDLKGNALPSPITLALSTGANIDSSEVKVQVFDAATAKAPEKGRVYLVKRSEDPTKDKALYSADIDSGGVAHFRYLPKQSWRPFYLEDSNRNRIIDYNEYAQPIAQEWVSMDSLNRLEPLEIVVFNPDTLQPQLFGLGELSKRRIRLQFSEPVVVRDVSSPVFKLFSSTNEPFAKAYHLYSNQEDASVTYAWLDKPLPSEGILTARTFSYVDASGNILALDSIAVNATAQIDTAKTELLFVLPANELHPRDSIIVTYSNQLSEVVTDSLFIIEGTEKRPFRNFRTARNRLILYPDTLWDVQSGVQFSIYDPWKQQFFNHSPKMIHPEDESKLVLSLTSTDSVYTRIEVWKNAFYAFKESRDTVVTFSSLTQSNVTLRAYIDLNEDKRWTQGQVFPFIPPEPIRIIPSIPLRLGFESEYELIFRR